MFGKPFSRSFLVVAIMVHPPTTDITKQVPENSCFGHSERICHGAENKGQASKPSKDVPSCNPLIRCKKSTRRNSAYRILAPPRPPPPRNSLCMPFSCILKGKEAPNIKNLRGQALLEGGSGRGGSCPNSLCLCPFLVPLVARAIRANRFTRIVRS